MFSDRDAMSLFIKLSIITHRVQSPIPGVFNGFSQGVGHICYCGLVHGQNMWKSQIKWYT